MDTPPRHQIWLISPYHTGSHRAWVQGYRAHSRHQVTLLSMPGRFWKWRMQGGAIELAAQAHKLLAQSGEPDVILATEMVNLPAWLALVRNLLPGSIPVALYMHENQLTYPMRPGEKRDLTYGMITWLSQLVADQILFNSSYHLESWFDELPRLLKHFPDFNHPQLVQPARLRSRVAPVGIDCHLFGPPERHATLPPLILWNQRWEYDKRPDRFFALLYRLQEAGVPFRLAVAGENFRQVPGEFAEAHSRLDQHIVHWGFLPSRADYVALLNQADLVISTADHEFFGISILEAACAGAFPLLPNRLSYPELIPPDLHPACLYEDEVDLFRLARQRLEIPRPAPPSLQSHIQTTFDWSTVAVHYDQIIQEMVGGLGH